MFVFYDFSIIVKEEEREYHAMLRMTTIGEDELLEEILHRRSIRGIPNRVKYSMTESEIHKDLSTVLKKLSVSSAKIQQTKSMKCVHRSPASLKKFIRVILVLAAYMLLVPVCIYQTIELGKAVYKEEQTLHNIMTSNKIHRSLRVMLQEMAKTLELRLRDGGNFSTELKHLHRDSDQTMKLKHTIIDCSKDSEKTFKDKPLRQLTCMRKEAVSSHMNLTEIVLKYNKIIRYLHESMVESLLIIDEVISYISFMTVDKVTDLGIHFLTAISVSASKCNITKDQAGVTQKEANLASGILDSIYFRHTLQPMRQNISSGLIFAESLIENRWCEEQKQAFNATSFFPVVDSLMSITESIFMTTEQNAKDAIKSKRISMYAYAVFIVTTSVLTAYSVWLIISKEDELLKQTTALEVLRIRQREQSLETEYCLKFYVPRDFFDKIPEGNKITLNMDQIANKVYHKMVQSDNNRRTDKNKAKQRSLTVCQTISDWSKRMIQTKKNIGKYSCPEKSVAVPRDSISTTLQMKTVTVFNSNFVKFNRLLQYCTPHQLISMVTVIMQIFDERIELYDVHVLNRGTNSYVAVSGITEKQKNNHATEIANMALDITNVCGDLEIERVPDCKLRLRVGLHTGLCFETLSGSQRPRYCIYGDVLNIAEQLQKTSMGTIGNQRWAQWQSSLIRHRNDCVIGIIFYNYTPRDDYMVPNGKSEMTYWLQGRRVSMCQAGEEKKHRESRFSRSSNWIPLELEMKAVYEYDSEEKGYIPARRWMMHRYSQESSSDGMVSSMSTASNFSQSNFSFQDVISRRDVSETLDETSEP